MQTAVLSPDHCNESRQKPLPTPFLSGKLSHRSNNLIQGANATFRVSILEDKDIDVLKEKIHLVSHPTTLGGSTAKLLKVGHEMGPALMF